MTADRIYQELKRKRPQYVLIYEDGEEPKKVPVVQGGRLKAQSATEAIMSCEWSRVELYGERDVFLGALSPYDSGEDTGSPDLEHESKLLELLLRAGNESSARVERLFSPALNSLIEANKLLLERVQQLEEHYIESLDIMREAFLSTARAELAEERLQQALEEQKEKEGLDGLAQMVMGAIGQEAIAPFVSSLMSAAEKSPTPDTKGEKK